MGKLKEPKEFQLSRRQAVDTMQGPVLEISLFQWSVELQRRNGHRVWTTPTNHISASRFKTRNPKFKIVLLSILKQSNTSWSFID